MSYSVETHLPAATWTTLAEDERIAMVEAAHREDKSPAGRDPVAHATIHVMVEDRLAAGDAAATRAFERLRASGLSRHACIHALASVVTRHMLATLEHGAPPDDEAVAHDFDALDPKTFARPR